VSGPFQIEGSWPGVVALRRSWGKAVARPWNQTTGHGALRLLRGNTSFLADATQWTALQADGSVFSPALYLSATRIWKRVGFKAHLELIIMEKHLGDEPGPHGSETSRLSEQTDLRSLEAIDRLAFDDFWHMDQAGLAEALDATAHKTVFTHEIDGEVVGYSIVGTQLGVSFLQRIAVKPAYQGRQVGTNLLAASTKWAAASGASTMLLNVREENDVARAVYATNGFTETKNRLHVLRYQA
jgi:[ribosomal protein S18]-alanine N-acetyltransferase